METDAEIAAPVVGPVVGRCRSLGLTVEDPLVLRSGANVVLRLDPAPVVARVATLTAAMRGNAAAYLAQERDVSNELRRRGLTVIAPTDLVDPGPHTADGHTFVLLERWDLQPVDLDSSDHARAAARGLVDLLTALSEFGQVDPGIPDGHPWSEMATMLQAVGPSVDTPVLDTLVDAVAELRATEPADPWSLIHGDAHRSNVALAGGEVIWFDFEDCNRRPQAWDLATLVRAWPAAGREACRLLDVDPGSATMRWHHELRELYALLWNLLYAKHHHRYREPTAKRLQGWLAGRGPGRP